MIENTTTPVATADEPRKNKRRPIIAFALAALAVGGIGAAATSAAWTDNVFFSAQAEAATFNLQGSTDGGTTWKESKTESSIELTIPAGKLANLLPGEVRTIDLAVLNDSSVGAAITSSVRFTGTTFATNPTASVVGLAGSLASGANDDFQLVVTAPENWDVANQGKTATIIVTVSGEATND
ncbi:hypothetical protein [Microbacterium invictum]